MSVTTVRATDSSTIEAVFSNEDSPAALEITGFHKSFGDTIAVNGLDLVVPRRSLYGVVGPNGAGKTTALLMAVGVLRPDAGQASIVGVDVWTRAVEAKRLVGVLPDGMAVPERLTGHELLSYLGLLRGMNPKVVEERANELLRVLDLATATSTLVMDYSAGMRKKILLATALLHGPKLLVLDEPFEAVDPVSATTIKAILRNFVASGGSVVLSSHVMSLVEELCDHVAVVARGKVVAAGPLDELRRGGSLEQLFMRLIRPPAPRHEDLPWLAS